MSMSYFTFHKLSKAEQAAHLAKLRMKQSNLLEQITKLRMDEEAVRVELNTLSPVPASPLRHDPALDGVPVRVIPAKQRKQQAPKIVLRPMS